MPEIKSLAGDLMQAQGIALFHCDAATTEMLHKSVGLTSRISGATLASAHSVVPATRPEREVFPHLLELEDNNITLTLPDRVSSELMVLRIIEWINNTTQETWDENAYWYRLLSAHRIEIVDACQKLG